MDVTRTKNEEVLKGVIKTLKLRYIGYIKRHQSIEIVILEGEVDGRRGRGRPRKRWEEDIKKRLGIEVIEAGKMATDRKQYRNVIWEATSERIC
ncbi:MAG: hypothetical protein ACWIPI_11120 [Polaribacter sp.]